MNKILITLCAALVAAQMFALHLMGHPAICTCGVVRLWYADPSGPETSQHLFDWYSFTHVIHGFLFYAALRAVAPRSSLLLRLALAIGIEVTWEIVENTPFIIDRYRQTALAKGYFGDSLLNSLSDTAAAIFGFFAARLLPVRASIAIVLSIEVFLAATIRDNLTLNIVQLLFPSEIVSRWQAGGEAAAPR